MSKAITYLKKDPIMARLIERIGIIHHRSEQLPPFQSLIRSVIHQQLSGRAAASIEARFLELFGGSGFPSPEQILSVSIETLRSAGLSRPKITYISGIAEKTAEGKIPSLEDCKMMSDELLIEQLTQLKGIGRWTVEMLLIFNLGRTDILPVDDLGVRRGYHVSHGTETLPKPRWLAEYGLRWAPYRTMASLYLWKASDLATP